MEARINFKNLDENLVKRGQIWMADLGVGVGSIQGGKRPVLIIQNDIGNKFAPTVNVVAVTGSVSKKRIPSHFEIHTECGVVKHSTVLCEQQFTLNKTQLISCVGQLTKAKEKELAKCLKIQFAIDNENDEVQQEQTVKTVKRDFGYIQKCLDTMETMKNDYEKNNNVIYLDLFKRTKEDLEKHCKEAKVSEAMYLRKYKSFISSNLIVTI